MPGRRVRGSSYGLWLTLRAGRIGNAGTPEERDIAVSIEETSPTERLALFARAFGLTGRERELLHHLASGSDTRDLARQMFVSEHTVQDHFKSIFAETSARSRSTLLSRAGHLSRRGRPHGAASVMMIKRLDRRRRGEQ
jgi:DNA-binding CsgD family transcriptional regulator